VKDVWVDAAVRGVKAVGEGAGKRRAGRMTTLWPDEIEGVDDGEYGEYGEYGDDRDHRRHARTLGKAKTSTPGSTARLLVERLRPDRLWALGYAGEGIRVGIFDTGVKEGHPDIRWVV